MKFKILGTGSYVPPKVVTNEELSTMVDTNDEWIVKRVGIKERHVSEDETTSDMATKAAKAALKDSGVKAQELDMILVATITPEMHSPSVACLVQRQIGATCPAMDISAACSGFIFAMETAAAYLALGKAKKILIIGAERLTGIVDWSDRGTCIIFADGAGAMVVSDEAENMLSSKIASYGDNETILIPMTSGCSPYYKGKVIKEAYITMNGTEVYKFAVNAMQTDVREVMEKAGLTGEDISYVIPHQANIRIINEAAKKLPIAKEKFCSNIHKTGNTSSASVAILLDEMNKQGKLKTGDKIVLAAFGGGLSSAACVIIW